MKHVEVSRQVDRSPDAVFPTVRDFRGYPAYSDFLERVSVDGDGGPGTEFVLELRLLGLSVETRTRLEQLEPPRRIDWTVVGELEASGRWIVTAVEDGNASRIELVVDYDPESIDSDVVSLPFGMSFNWIRDKAEALAEREAGTVLDRIVADLESNVE